MDNKLSELKAVADYWRKVKSGELPAPGPNEISITVCTLDAAVSRIAALLAELEAKTLEYRLIEQERELFRVERTAHQQHAQELEKRIAELETLLERNKMRVEKLRELLATPVRLSGTTHPRCRQQHADDIRAAGFKCVGDE